jgi:DNA-binding response OmpR family regulator
MASVILSVGSISSINFLLQTAFEKNFTFITASNAYEAMRQLRSKVVHLVIVDIDFFPNECRGFIQHIKSSSLFKIPVFVLSSKKAQHEVNLHDLFIDELLIKPFNPLELLHFAKDALTIKDNTVAQN